MLVHQIVKFRLEIFSPLIYVFPRNQTNDPLDIFSVPSHFTIVNFKYNVRLPKLTLRD